jgi:hypothetical protein
MVPFRTKALTAAFFSLALCLVAVAQRQSVALQGQTSSLPDYAIQDLSVSPSRPQAGEEMSFHGTVRNVGTSRGTHRDFVQLQLDQGNDGYWDYTGNLAIVAGLPVGSSQSVQWGITGNPAPIAWTPIAGTHRMKICLHQANSIDAEAYTADANPANDCATFIFTVGGSAASSSSSVAASSVSSRMPLADFVVSSFSITDGPTFGKFTAHVTVKNLGADASIPTHVILEYHATGGTSWESIVPDRDIPVLRSGQEAGADWNDHGRGMSGTAPLAVGTYDFRACADAWNLVSESNETNCTAPALVKITDVSVSSSSSSSRAASSSSSSRAASSARSSSSSSRASAVSSSSRSADRSLPNLVIRAFRVTPRSFAAGGRWGIRASVVNFGGSASLETDAVLKIDVNNDNRDVFNDGTLRVIPPLNPNGGKFDVLWSTAANPKIEWTSVAGTHRVGICVNERRQATESNYNDNCAWSTIRVRAAGGTAPVLYNPNADTPSR